MDHHYSGYHKIADIPPVVLVIRSRKSIIYPRIYPRIEDFLLPLLPLPLAEPEADPDADLCFPFEDTLPDLDPFPLLPDADPLLFTGCSIVMHEASMKAATSMLGGTRTESIT